MAPWRPPYMDWLLVVLILSSAFSLYVVGGVELACDSVLMSGTFTVSNDVSCTEQTTLEVAKGAEVVVAVSVNSTITLLRFVIKYGGSLAFTGAGEVIFANNDGTHYFSGGAINNHGTISFGSATTFSGNIASTDGGALYNAGIVSFASAAAFTGNTASSGGAIFNESDGTLKFASAATFTGNTASSAGNAVYTSSGNVTFCLTPGGMDFGQDNFYGSGIDVSPSLCSSPLTPAPSLAPTLFAATVSPTLNSSSAPTLAPSAVPTQISSPSLAPTSTFVSTPTATTGNNFLISETPAPSQTSSPTALDSITPADVSGTPDVSSSSSGPNIGLIAGISAGGVILLLGIGFWIRPRYKSGCLGTVFKPPHEGPSSTPAITLGKDVYSNQAAPIGAVNGIHDLVGAQQEPSSPKEEIESATLVQHVNYTNVIVSGEDAIVVSPQLNKATYQRRAVIVEAGLMAFAAAGAVASHIPWVKDIYGLCDEIVKLLEANEETSRNHAEIVKWICEMQATLSNVANALGSCSDDYTRVNEALAGRAFTVLSHVKDTMEQHARRNMLTQFLLSRKLQGDLQEAGKYFIEAIQALQLGLSAQQFEATTKLLSISMKIDDDLSDIMSVVKNNEVMLAKVILQLAARFPSLRDGDTFEEDSEASTASLTPHSAESEKKLVSEASVSSIPNLERVNKDFIISLHNGKPSKSVPIAAVVEALERLHIAPSDIMKLDSHPVGQGGFSKVYRVKVGEQIAAAKVVDLGALSAHQVQSVYKRFAKELYILSLLKSPYVVTIIGASATLDELALITEFMPRGSLRKVMDNPEEWSKFSMSMSLTILLDVARGMLYLEKEGVRHRDLKSHNILVTADSHAKLIDFGLSKTCDAITKSTETSARGAAGGTLPWTAPELFDMGADGTPEQGSFKSDVYSFGVVIWEILAGPKQRPWGGIPMGTLINSVLRGRKPPLPADALQYPELHTIMNHCMEFDPASRPTFADVCTQLIELEESRTHR